MKKYILALIFTISFMINLSAKVHQLVILPKPFNQLNIPDGWRIQEGECDENFVSFAWCGYSPTFQFAVGKPVKEASLNLLQKQLENFHQKKSKTIPLIRKSFNLPLDIFKEDLQLCKPIERVSYGPYVWLKMVEKGELPRETYVDVVYATIINKRLHLIIFSGSGGESFEAADQLYEDTIRMICESPE